MTEAGRFSTVSGKGQGSITMDEGSRTLFSTGLGDLAAVAPSVSVEHWPRFSSGPEDGPRLSSGSEDDEDQMHSSRSAPFLFCRF